MDEKNYFVKKKKNDTYNVPIIYVVCAIGHISNEKNSYENKMIKLRLKIRTVAAVLPRMTDAKEEKKTIRNQRVSEPRIYRREKN